MSKFIPEERIERLAAETLRSFQLKSGSALELPIDVDLIGEILFELIWEYEPLSDPYTLAALFARSRTIKMNELHLERFREKPGLERFTKAHEIGHWVLHVDQTVLGLGYIPGFEKEERVLCRDGAKNQVEWQADHFAASLLMPHDITMKVGRDYNLTSWPSLYQMAETFEVTISALRIRLERLGLIYVAEDGTLYRSKEVRYGQQTLF